MEVSKYEGHLTWTRTARIHISSHAGFTPSTGSCWGVAGSSRSAQHERPRLGQAYGALEASKREMTDMNKCVYIHVCMHASIHTYIHA